MSYISNTPDNTASGATPSGLLVEGWDSANSKLRALKVDASQNLNVNVAAALPAGTAVIGHVIIDSGSTTVVTGSVAVTGTFWQATQPVSGTVALSAGAAVIGHVIVDSGAVNATLSAETTKVIGTVNISAAQTIATTNAGTFATQATLAAETTKVIGTVNVAAAQTIAATQSGTWTVQPGNTPNTSPWLANPANVVATGNITNTQAVIVSTSGQQTVTMNVTGTWTGTLQPQLSVDGTNFVNVGVIPFAPAGASASTLTANGQWWVVIGGTSKFQILGASVGSGTAVVTLNASPAGFGQLAVQSVAANLNCTAVLAAGAAVIGHVIVDSGAIAATLAAETTKVIGTVNVASSQTIAVTNAGTFVTQSTLAAETTKVIGVVRTSDGAGNLFTSNSITPSAKFSQDQNITSILGTAPTTVGKLDVKAVDGDVFVRQTTAANLNCSAILVAGSAVIGHVIVDSGAVTATLAAETTKVIGTVNVAASQTIATTNAGTFAVQATLAAETTKVIGTVNPPAITKNTQSANGFSVQNLADAGRTYVMLYAQLITGVTTEAIATFSKNVNGTVTTAQTGYTITSGKTFVIQSFSYQVKNTTTTTNNATFNVRVAPAGSVAASSPIVLSGFCSSASAAATNIGAGMVDVPGGIYLLGDGTVQIGISHLESVTTAAITSFILIGYEF